MSDCSPVADAEPAASYGFLAGGGEAALRIRDFDWSATSVGSIGSWPQSLRTALSMMLCSKFPSYLAWGSELISFYNDAYRPLLGDKPDALGRPFPQVWSEAWDVIGPIAFRALAGEASFHEKLPLTVMRFGYPEQAWFTFSYSPVRQEDGQVGGLLCTVHEVTGQVLAEEALRAERDRSRSVLENITDGFILLDQDFRVLDINAEGMRLEKRPREAIIGKTHWEAWPGTEHSELGRLYKRAMRERVPISLEHRYVWPDGHDAWLDTRAYPTEAGLALFYRDVTEYRREESRLRETHERLRTLVNQAAAGICQADTSGRIVLVNDRFCELLGRSRDELYGQPLLELTHPEDVPAKATALARLMETGEPFFIEKRYVRPDGSHIWVSNHVSLARDEHGRPQYASVVVIDVSERKRTEEALREREERLRVAQAAGGIGTFELMPDTGRIVVSEQFCRLWGVPFVPETDVRRFIDLIHPADRERVYTDRSSLPERALDYIEYRVVRPDTGETRWMARQGEAVYDAVARRKRYFGVSYDITDKKMAEQALEEERQTLEVLNRTGAALAAELDLDRIVQMVTDAGVELTGAQFGAFFYNVLDDRGESFMLYTLSGVDRSAFENLPMPRATAVFRPTFHGEGIVRVGDIMADPRYGKSAPYHGMPKGHLPVRSYLAVPVMSRTGEVLGGLFFGHPEPDMFTERAERVIVGLAAQAAIAVDNARLLQATQREIEERRHAQEELRRLNETLENRVAAEVASRLKIEEALRQSQKMEAIGQLTGGVAHDFNNLLTVIRSSVDLLRRKELPPEKQRRYIDAIAETADRAARLTSALLSFSRRQALKPEVFDVAERVAAIGDMIRTLVGPRIALELHTGAPAFVEADVAQFETALVNMAVNARDAMDGDGRLTIGMELANQAGEDFVAVSISDTGHGIPPDLVAKIFDPFFTTKEVGKGTGLGLSQVIGFAKQSGGEVQVRSKVGEGTTFTLYLPRSYKKPAAAEPSEPPQEPSTRRLRILVVEDNVDVGEFATQLLRELGHDTTWAPSAEAALARLETESEDFDLLFSDVVMPGIGGIALGQEVRRRYPDLPVVLTSGYSHVLADEGHHGFDLLHKPYSVEGLSRVIQQVLGRRRADQSPTRTGGT